MVNIPEEVFTLYESVVDDFINSNFGVNCKLYFPPRKVKCTECTTNPVSGGSSNMFSGSGPAPFNFSCPTCGGDGYIEEEVSEIIKARIYYNRKDFIKVADVNIPQGAIQIIGFYSDLPSYLRANEIEPNTDKAGFRGKRYTRLDNYQPHGFKKRRYFISFMEQV